MTAIHSRPAVSMRRTEPHQSASIRLAFQSKDIRRWSGRSRWASQQKLHPLSAMRCAHTERFVYWYRVRRPDLCLRETRQNRTEAISECLASLSLKRDLQLVVDAVPGRTLQPPARRGMSCGLFVRFASQGNHHPPNFRGSKPPADGCVN